MPREREDNKRGRYIWGYTYTETEKGIPRQKSKVWHITDGKRERERERERERGERDGKSFKAL